MRLVILARISRSRRMPNVLVNTKWAKMRGLSEFQLLLRTPRHSASNIAVKRHPTAPEGVARCTISELVRHALWSGGAPLHSNFGGGMAGGSQQELEL